MAELNLPKIEINTHLTNWQKEKPARNLPWLGLKDPYLVWVSEIMLQQTRVQTVIPYFERFIQSFPSAAKLSEASLDHVLSHWAGLGFYTRARNLHAAARIIKEKHNGQFPRTFDEIVSLPGIGKSTAGAICSLALDIPKPILDGNAKRVYSRLYCVDGESISVREKTLWKIAEAHTPEGTQSASFTQAIMDLGATVCLPRKPHCELCPVSEFCCAFGKNVIANYPVSSATSKIPSRSVAMIMVVNDDKEILLEKRPLNGIWGGLWSFPEYSGKPEHLEHWFVETYAMKIQLQPPWDLHRHQFSHFTLDICPQPAQLLSIENFVGKPKEVKFIRLSNVLKMGIPAPVSKFVNKLTEPSTHSSPN